MHELGVLRHVVMTVARTAKANNIGKVKFITLEVGDESSYVPYYLEKLFPTAIEFYPEIGTPELRLINVAGKKLQIKDIGY
ncbi:MAG: hydrogenase/urease maturation nickel metallochaperone HypA [Bacillota bacterium]|nr:hydrogenase/urease maturation nickel metallochaperone HypA [Bacillota bacterium]